MVCTVLAEDGLDEITREKMVSAMEKAVLSLGEPTYEDGMKKAVKLLEFAANGARSMETVDGLRSSLDGLEPLSKRDEKILLFALQNLPSLLRLGFKMAAKRASADLPAPPGGRPPVLTAEKAKEAIDYVWDLTRKGASMDAAKFRAVQKFRCSRRTIDRLCANRGSDPEDRPTMADVIRLLTEGE